VDEWRGQLAEASEHVQQLQAQLAERTQRLTDAEVMNYSSEALSGKVRHASIARNETLFQCS